jgi:hypothetical protein
MFRSRCLGYCFGIPSKRRLCDEVHLNLAYRWSCRLRLDCDVRDHSTFSKNRHGRFRESGLLRKLFETVVARCMKEGLVGGEAFAVDASMIVADACRRRGVAKVDDLDPTSSRPVEGRAGIRRARDRCDTEVTAVLQVDYLVPEALELPVSEEPVQVLFDQVFALGGVEQVAE